MFSIWSPNSALAGKSGTTDNYADAWFNGYTPRLEAAVWIGYPSGEIPMLSVHGIAVSGPTFPAQIWHSYMETAIGNHRDVQFTPASSEPVWTSWRGQYQYGGAYGLASTTDTTTAGTTTSTRRTTTTAPPPATTTAPPPVTTTAPTTAPLAPPTETTPTPSP